MTDEAFSTVFRWEGPPLLEIQQARVRLPSGVSYLANRLRMQGGRPGVVVIAQHGDTILLARSTRPAAGESLLELPRGFGEAEDGTGDERASFIAGAERELTEETGFSSASSSFLGTYITDSSVYPGMVGVVHCLLKDTQAAGELDGELDGIGWVPIKELRMMLVNGTLHDAHTLSALALWFAHGQPGMPNGGLHLPA